MTLAHHGETQANLRKLYCAATELDKSNLGVAVDELKTRDNAVHVLDIGCGSCPYGDAFVPLLERDPQARERFHLWEASSNIENVQISGNGQLFEFSAKKGLHHLDALSELAVTAPRQQYDLVVLAATLHELTICNSERKDCWKPFLPELLDALRRITKPDGYLVISDFFVSAHLFSEELRIIQSFQQFVLGHGDPPSAFCDPKNVVLAARRSGFRVERLNFSLPLQGKLDDELLDFIRTLAPSRIEELETSGEIALPGVEAKQKWSEIAHLLRQRPYFSAVFKAQPVKPESDDERSANERRYSGRIDDSGELLKLVTKDALDVSRVLDDFHKELTASPHLFDADKDSREAIRAIFEEYMGGLLSDGSGGVFARVTDQVYDLVELWLMGHQQTPVNYLTTYLGINSEVLAESGRSTRFLPTYTETTLRDGAISTDKRGRSFGYIGGKPRDDGRDWTTIGFHHLLSTYMIRHADGGPEYSVCGPSVHQWFTRLQESGQWKRSLTISCPSAGNASNTDAASRVAKREQDRIMATAFLNAPDSLHNLVCLDDEVSPFEYGKTINDALKQLTKCAYCAPPSNLDSTLSKLWLRWLEGIASVWYDFLFLSRNVSESASLLDCLEAFESRWTNPNSSDVIYVDLAQGMVDVEEIRELQEAKCLLPKGFEEQIQKTVSDAKAFLEALGPEQSKDLGLPNSMVTLSLTNVGEHSQSYGTFMMFLDSVLDWRLTDLVSILVQRPYHLIREIESNLKTRHDAVTSQKATETAIRQNAVAGFSHQVGHIFGDKSSFSLASFTDPTGDTKEDEFQRLADVWRAANLSTQANERELHAREAQIRYASTVPSVIKSVLKPQPDKNVFGAEGEGRGKPGLFVSGVARGMVIPLMYQVSGEKDYRCRDKQLDLSIQEDSRAGEVFVPSNELTKAVLFEVFWNAFRHGDWAKSDAIAKVHVDIRTEGGFGIPSKIVIIVTNPCLEPPERALNRGLSYIRQFIDGVRVMRGGGVSDCAHEWDATRKQFISRVVLPFATSQRD